MGVAELRRLKQLEEENRKLKQLVADLSLDKHMLQDVLKKSGETGDATTDGPVSYLKLWPECPTRLSGPSSRSLDLQVSE
jgi:putative transposase